MPSNVHYLKDRGVDSEKITLNLGFVDLGRIDLLVQEGFYSNRTDLIRTAIRNQLDKHAEAVKELIVRQTLRNRAARRQPRGFGSRKKSGRETRNPRRRSRPHCSRRST